MPGWAPSRRFDQEECIEVAWNRVRLRALDPAMVDRRHAEVRLLRSLHRDHIIGFQEVWLDHDAGVLNFITEVCNSASLREYFDRHKHVSVRALKKWALLEGLDHLHTRDPCIIHRDRTCSNVFSNGNTGHVIPAPINLARLANCLSSHTSWFGQPQRRRGQQ
uniref:non-specific serine/threonine protein kinase n=1 Tax=Triticum urartu TaxID=4572 RepID=A0A8R7TV12_TRIUA